ncbi:PREDICTED: cytochrome P450 2J2-like [Gekko japonicus]|uniref:Cytochrome P450 2J2-like n=1 Tax=Gekko japonicus TaxID=146911 RepID=A0ABM1JZU5_GEKJA|nr:PREDICTED: cytochrome P450 2J2-like [Gekko japonicus]
MFHSLDIVIQYVASPFHLLYFITPKWIRRLVGPPRKPARAAKTARAFAREEVRNHKKNMSPGDPQDFTDFYLNQIVQSTGDPAATYDEHNLVKSMLDLFGAGIDTTAITLYWALLYMAAYPHIQATVQKELDDVLGPSPVICYDDRKRLPYTHAVVHEVLRYSSIFSTTFRRCTKDTVIQGFPIKKGTTIAAILYSSLFDPEQWKTPHQFNPNHFLDEDGNFVSKEAFVPFSAGHRVCVGEQIARIELFIVLSSLLQEFTFRAPEGVKEMNMKRQSKSFIVRPQPYTICAIPRSATGKEGPW